MPELSPLKEKKKKAYKNDLTVIEKDMQKNHFKFPF